MLKTLNNLAPCRVGAAFGVVAVVAGLGITTRANALTEYESRVTCPIDGQQFMATSVGSFYQRGMRLDSKPLGALVAPIPYPVCPDNGFVLYKDDFPEDELRVITAMVNGEDYRRARAEHTDYYMVAYVKERLGGDDYDLGNMYLRASWEAERDKPQLVRPYQALAIEKYDAFVERDSTHSKDWWTASVVAAELNRLLGNFDNVEVRLQRLPSAPDAIMTQVVNQIRLHALNRNAMPEAFQREGGKTIGYGGKR